LRRAVVSTICGLLANIARIPGLCGNRRGIFSKKRRSYATITVTGAVRTFSTFAGASAG
jgi:hypothetical protein